MLRALVAFSNVLFLARIFFSLCNEHAHTHTRLYAHMRAQGSVRPHSHAHFLSLLARLLAARRRDAAPNVKVMAYSTDGTVFAWNNGGRVNVVNTTSGKLLQHFPRPKTIAISISPGNNFVATWENYSGA
jgi:hypothetical protein